MTFPAGNNQKGEKKMQRKLFSIEEDAKLRFLVLQYGTSDFKKIASMMPGRSTRQVRERYKNYLSPEINNGPWSRDEDNLLRQKYNELGPKWSKIAEFFPSRSDINVKNRWTSIGGRSTSSSSIINSSLPTDAATVSKLDPQVPKINCFYNWNQYSHHQIPNYNNSLNLMNQSFAGYIPPFFNNSVEMPISQYSSHNSKNFSGLSQDNIFNLSKDGTTINEPETIANSEDSNTNDSLLSFDTDLFEDSNGLLFNSPNIDSWLTW